MSRGPSPLLLAVAAAALALAAVAALSPAVSGSGEAGGEAVVPEADFDPQGHFHIVEDVDRTLTVDCAGGERTLDGYRIEYDGDATLETGTLFTRSENVDVDPDLNYNWVRGAEECRSSDHVKSPFVEVGPD